MSLQNFIDKIGPVVSAAWLNVVDSIKYTIFEDAHTKADARTALTADAPMEVENGGTGVRTLADFMTTLNMGAGFGAELSNTPAPGPPLSGTGVLNIGLVASHTQLVNLSGVTITSFGTSADVAYPIYILRFFGAHTLVHSSSLVLPGAANITTAAGDYAIVQYIGAATGWRVAFYQRASAGSTYVEGDSIGFSPGHDFYLDNQAASGVDCRYYGFFGVADKLFFSAFTDGKDDGAEIFSIARTDAYTYVFNANLDQINGLPLEAKTWVSKNASLNLPATYSSQTGVYHPSGGGAGDTFTIVNSDFPNDGTILHFLNKDANAVSIACSGATMYLSPAGTTGTRTLAQYGRCWAEKIAGDWYIYGYGLT